MAKLLVGLICLFGVYTATAQNTDFPEKGHPSADNPAETRPERIQPSREDLKVIAVMEILELMDLMEQIDMMKDLEFLAEEDQNEN